ncbi:MAG: TIGR00282 family metallophosphoesterase [Kiritimatiellae bacterium]|nr:TIGR00282 family metallophosphoesterase [Kiritimatiellia bacterium]
MKILAAGDIVSSPGRLAFARTVDRLCAEGEVDGVVANAENAAGGNGLLPRLAQELFRAGADVLTLGDHAWDQKEILPYLDEEYRLIRPANYVSECPGNGWTIVDIGDWKLCVISLVGRTFMPPVAECPFKTADRILALPEVKKASVVLVDFHAEATSEKICMGYYLDGRVGAVLGTHTHVQTSDEHVLPRGTGYITDMGMTGPVDSVLGRQFAPVLNRFLTGMPSRFEVKKGSSVFEGVLLDMDEQTGRCRDILRIREFHAGPSSGD